VLDAEHLHYFDKVNSNHPTVVFPLFKERKCFEEVVVERFGYEVFVHHYETVSFHDVGLA
jgi:hypothetical protein